MLYSTVKSYRILKYFKYTDKEFIMKKAIIVFFTFLLFTIPIFSAKINVGKDKIVKVNNRIITLSELEKKYNDISEAFPDKSQVPSKKVILQQMIYHELLVNEAKNTKSIILDEKTFNQYLNYFKQNYTNKMKNDDPKFVYSDDKFKKYLEKEEHITYEKFEEGIKDNILKEQYIMKQVEPKIAKLRAKTYTSKDDFPVKIPDLNGELKSYNSLKEFYDKNKAQFFLDSPVYVKHIFKQTVIIDNNNKIRKFPAEEKDKVYKIMKDIYNRLLKGESFSSLCELYSDDDQSKNYKDPATGKLDRGYIGPIVKSGNLYEMQKQRFGEDLVKKILNLPAGKYSPVLEGLLGYHIFYVIKKLDHDVLKFEDIKDNIIATFKEAEYQMILQEEESKIIDNLKKKASIVYYDDEYKE